MDTKIKKIYTVFYILILCFILAGCKNDDYIDELSNLQEEVNRLKEENENKDKELNDLQSSLGNKNQEIENKIEELDELQKIIENNQNQIDDLLVSNKLDGEIINVISKMFYSGISLDEYLSFKENNQKIKNDEDLEKLLDKIYYYNNKECSITHLKEIIEADDFDVALNWGYAYDYYVYLKLNMDDYSNYNNIKYNYNFYFFDSENECDMYLDLYLKCFDREVLRGNNFFIYPTDSLSSESIINKELIELEKYINKLISDDTLVDAKEFFDEINRIKDEYNYKYEVSFFSDLEKTIDSYCIGKDGKQLAHLYYLEKENDLNYFDYKFAHYGFNTTEMKKQFYSQIYFYGRIVVVPIQNSHEEISEEISDSYLYNYLLSNYRNGLDIYNSMNDN